MIDTLRGVGVADAKVKNVIQNRLHPEAMASLDLKRLQAAAHGIGFKPAANLQRAGWASAILRKLVDEEAAGRGDAVEAAAARVPDAGAADTSAEASFARSIPRRIKELTALDPEAAAARDWKKEGEESPRATLTGLDKPIKTAKKKPGGTNGNAGSAKKGSPNSPKGRSAPTITEHTRSDEKHDQANRHRSSAS